jgi:hypothetical protein
MGGSQFKTSLGQKVSEIPSQQTSWAWWFISVLSAMQKAEVGGSPSEDIPGKSMRLYLKNKLKQKEMEV